MTASPTGSSPSTAADQFSPERTVVRARPPAPPLPRRGASPGTTPGQENPPPVTGPAPAAPAGAPARDDLTQRVFRALYPDYELRTVGGIYVVIPRGTPWHAGPSLGEIARQLSTVPAPAPAHGRARSAPPLPAGPGHLTSVPAPGDAARLSRFLQDHPHWSAFWDKHAGVWRVAEDDPDSGLSAEGPDADTVIGYITRHS
jgi:hypothetical protein